jgi:hypothetical protein
MRHNCFVAVWLFLLSCFCCWHLSAQGWIGAWGSNGVPGPPPPKGIYLRVDLATDVNQAETAAYPGGLPAYPNAAADAILVRYFTTLLDNPATSGLALAIQWSLLNPNDPGPDPFHPAAGAYTWNSLDDVFVAVDQWNRSHPGVPPKTIQLLPDAGFNSPGWIVNAIDASVCRGQDDCTGAGSCDALFMSSPAKPASHDCGYTTIFFRTESNPIEQLPLPLAWNWVYEKEWHTFLFALNRRIQQGPASNAFVSISMAGPTASSTEMTLPNARDQSGEFCPSGGLYLNETFKNNGNPVCPSAIPEFDVPTAWNMLFANFYGPDPKYQNTDLPFIEAWDAEIDAYGQIFNGVTLTLTPNTDPLPSFPTSDTSLLIPAPGFVPDCGNDPLTNPSGYDPGDAMSCAAITQILTHFVNPFVGGFNGKSTQENAMNARTEGIDLGINGIKWLAAATAGGRAPLPGTPFHMSQILGGAQFDKSLVAELMLEGCPDYTANNPNPPRCNNLTIEEGLVNVLSISSFPGTAAGPFFCAYTTDGGLYGCGPTSVDDTGGTEGNYVYSDAPMNYLQIYDNDALYASGLSNCTMLEITGNPVDHVPPTCVASITADVTATQTELNLASKKLLSIAESATFWSW